MARGLVLSSQSKTTNSHFILSSILRASSQTQFGISPFSRKFRFSRSFPSVVRLLCYNCTNRQHQPIDMSQYKDTFAKRMAMAGLKPHHRIAVGVSGGPDSMALCILAAGWKTGCLNVTDDKSSGTIDGLLAIIVDHGLRAESKDEAQAVSLRLLDMGIRCEIAHCEWLGGRPKQGHLQEAARDRRYEIFQNVCFQHHIGLLLLAHHADDQAESFVLRLSRNSGVLGLAGMAFVTQLFSRYPNVRHKASADHSLLLVRPLLQFSKNDLYKICQGSNQEWVEDPTNQSPLFARNRIRMALKTLASGAFNTELQAVISACRRTRMYVDQRCHTLINQSVTIMPHGFAVIDIVALNPSEVEDICLSKYISLLLQFISQRHRPVRGSASKLLLEYFRTFPSKTSFTAASCYLCPAPGSKGTKILICSADSALPLKIELFPEHYEGQKHYIPCVVDQIIANGKSFSDGLAPDIRDVHFLDALSTESLLFEAKRLGILSESTSGNILSLQRVETDHFRAKTEVVSDRSVEASDVTLIDSITLLPRHVGYFMNRFLIMWKLSGKVLSDAYSHDGVSFENLAEEDQHYSCRSCLVGPDRLVKVRHMVDADWLYLANLSRCCPTASAEQRTVYFAEKMDVERGQVSTCLSYARESAQRALRSLKSIPVAARRGLPVLVNPQGLLLSIPSVGFDHCPCVKASVVFRPRVPLGGGHSSFV